MKKDAVLEFDEAEGLFGGRSSTYSVVTALAALAALVEMPIYIGDQDLDRIDLTC